MNADSTAPRGSRSWNVINGDSLLVLPTLAPQSVHCVVTSPPYFNLRDYNVPPTAWPEVVYAPMAGLCPVTIPAQVCCLGAEADPLSFIGHVVEIFRGVWRVLRDDGTAWVNFGDSYAGSGKGGVSAVGSTGQRRGRANDGLQSTSGRVQGLKQKDLVGIPWRVGFALQADGWYLRMDNVWEKPNCMPESVTDRPTRAHEYLFLFSKSTVYEYDCDAVREPHTEMRYFAGEDQKTKTTGFVRGTNKYAPGACGYGQHENGRNKRSIWSVPTIPYKEAHFAVFPPDLIRPCIRAGCPVGGIVLDPFSGSGTTGKVAIEEGRGYVGIDLSGEYCPMSERRLGNAQPPLFGGLE